MGKFLLGIIVGILLVFLAAYLFIRGGGLPMNASANTLPMEEFLAKTAIVASVGNAAKEQAPIPADETNLLAGARIYQTHGCVDCHGYIGDPNSGMGKNFHPVAPHLLPPSEGVTDDEVGETHWIVKNGIRFSGMPTFNTQLNETELWQVSLLLHNANKLPASVQEALRQRSGAEGSRPPTSNMPAPSASESASPVQSPGPRP
jgi:mono/diheme cytochrome c family protein